LAVSDDGAGPAAVVVPANVVAASAPPSVPPKAPAAPIETADAAPAAEPASVPEPEPIVLRGPITDLDDETRALLEARLERERQADRRFEAGIEASQVQARDIDARVQAAFERVELAPELVDGGFMRGLRLRAVHGGSPLDEAGFRVGDLLVRLDGRSLDDPAELPDVLADAGPHLSLCALRGETEFCRDLVLR
jgi:hypothetical protein